MSAREMDASLCEMDEVAREADAGAYGKREPYDAIVCGGGPAGMAAALAAWRCGCTRTLLVEREDFLGGVLPQCVHDGFSLHLTGRSLTGPEYARELRDEVLRSGIEVALSTSVVNLAPPSDTDVMCTVRLVGVRFGGAATLRTETVIMATGCRERTRGQLRIPGSRPAGVMTAGSAQYLLNIRNGLIGDKVVILGSGDIGLIMARRLTLEGAEVRLVLGQEATGLYRNHVQCIEEFGIPIRYGWTVTSLSGRGRLKGVTVAPYVEDGHSGIAHPDLARREYIRCNALLIATGLIPERDLLSEISPDAWSIASEATCRTPMILCGNVSEIHDLVDAAVVEATSAGIMAARRHAGLAAARRHAGLAAARRGMDLDAATSLAIPDKVARLAGTKVDEGVGARMTASDAEGRKVATVCTLCPSACAIEIVTDVDGARHVEGAGCGRGERDILDALEHPMRLFTGTVAIAGAGYPLVPVRTVDPVPQELLLTIARSLGDLTVHAPVLAGDVLVADVAGTGTGLIATDDRPVQSDEGAAGRSGEPTRYDGSAQRDEPMDSNGLGRPCGACR